MNCRSCGKENLSLIMSYGDMPLANGLLSSPDEEEKLYPLELYFCNDCSLVQIGETVSPELLFQDYAYFSSCSNTISEHARELVNSVIEKYNPKVVVEIASNDGYLLRHYPESVTVIGVDPAANVAEMAKKNGVNTIVDFFSYGLSEEMKLQYPKVDVIHANNVLAHVADMNDFVAGVANLLDDDGVFIVEVPYVRWIIQDTLFDTVYHEHLCYFSIASLYNLFKRHGLNINNVQKLDVHGGSLRLFVSKMTMRLNDVKSMMNDELQNLMHNFIYYSRFESSSNYLRHAIKATIDDLDGSIAAVGASAKGNVLLNFCNIDNIEYIGDNIQRKQGLYTPGKHIPIVPMETIIERQPDYLLILAWNHADEIMNKLSDYKGKFIIPVPEVRII